MNKKRLTTRNLSEQATELGSRHPALGTLVELVGKLRVKIPHWQRLNDAIVYSIVGQMLSNKASSAIIDKLYRRFETSENILRWACYTAHRPGALCGLSQGKRKALKSWSTYSKCHADEINDWQSLSLNRFRNEVSKVWGLGVWSADMLGIFYYARPDVWPEGDTGLKRVALLIFGEVDFKLIEKYIIGIETVAALYLWELINLGLEKEFVLRRSDSVDITKRSVTMRKVTSKGTTPEVALAKELKTLGITFQEQPKDIFGRPDFFIPEANTAIFVDSDFWHGHPERFRLPRSNVEYWAQKIERNRKRDVQVNNTLAENGCNVLRFWEYDIIHNKAKCIELLLNKVIKNE